MGLDALQGLAFDAQVAKQRVRASCVFGNDSVDRLQGLDRAQRDVTQVSNGCSNDEKNACHGCYYSRI
jgi:hypothetical protein